MRSDNQLISKIRQKQDRKAADELIGRYYREIYAYTYRQTGDKELAMDLTQDIFVTVLQGLFSFDAKKAKFRTWLYKVASNKITDWYRSRAYRQRQAEQSLGIEEAGSELTSSEAEKVIEQVLDREIIKQIMKIVSGFDTDYIRIFQKKCFEEMTFKEISEEMQLSENTVKTRFYSILKRLRKEVEQ